MGLSRLVKNDASKYMGLNRRVLIDASKYMGPNIRFHIDVFYYIEKSKFTGPNELPNKLVQIDKPK